MESFEIPKREDPAAAGMRQKVQVRESNPDWTPFRTLEKKFKTQYPPPDVSKVLDLACLDPARAAEVQSSSWKGKADAFDYIDISGGNSTRKAYTFPDIPGLLSSSFSLLPVDMVSQVLSSFPTSFRKPNRKTWYSGPFLLILAIRTPQILTSTTRSPRKDSGIHSSTPQIN